MTFEDRIDEIDRALNGLACASIVDADGAQALRGELAAHARGGTLVDDLATLRNDPEIAELFIAEAFDHLGTIETAVLGLDDRPGDAELLDDIFRPFHTVKGNAGALGLTSVQEVAHCVENLLDLARSGRHAMGPTEVDLILRAVDVLTLMISDINKRLKGRPAADLVAAVHAFTESVDRVIAGGSATEGAVEAGPEAAPVPRWLNAAGGAATESAPEATPAQWAAAPSAEASAQRVDDVPGPAAVKVDARKLDDLIDVVGELIAVQGSIQDHPAIAALPDGDLAHSLGQLKRITGELQRGALGLRLVPVRQAFQKVARVVRDLSRSTGKPVELVLAGEDTELDRKMVEDITDPLVHMVRNSMDHGIESPSVRHAAGKRVQARLALSASHQGGHIVLEVADDGAGLDTERIRQKAVERGLLQEEAPASAEEIHRLIFVPGFSTVETVTEISGRGVGMDVVRRNIEGLRGRIEIRSEPARGTTFLIKLPLTIAVLEGLVVAAGRERFVLPTSAVRGSLRPVPRDVHTVAGRPRMVQAGDTLLPLVFLGELLEVEHSADPANATVLVIEDEGRRVGLVVDELLTTQQVVIRPLGETFGAVRGIAGGAILDDGRIRLVLDVHGIFDLIRTGRRTP